MNLKPISLCTTELFKSLNKHTLPQESFLPSLAIHNHVIFHDGKSEQIINKEVCQKEATQILLSFYPQLQTIQWAEIQQLKSYSLFDHDEFCRHFHYRWHSNSHKLISGILSFSNESKVFLVQKKAKLNDLLFMSSVSQLSSEQQTVFQQLEIHSLKLRPSYQEYLQILELGLESLLLGQLKAISSLLDTTDVNTESFILLLKKIRFPESSAIQEQREQLATKIPWPPFAQVKTTRRGDRVGFDVHFFISGTSDVIKTQAALDRVRTSFQELEEKSQSLAANGTASRLTNGAGT